MSVLVTDFENQPQTCVKTKFACYSLFTDCENTSKVNYLFEICTSWLSKDWKTTDKMSMLHLNFQYTKDVLLSFFAFLLCQ